MLKGATQLRRKIIFVSAAKISENTAKILKFSKANLHFVTLNQIPTDKKLNLLLIKSILALEIQRRHK